MLKDKSLTYVSLFSCAGVGCYGFKQEGYHCIATNELSDRRLEVQRANNKCELESGYVPGDISDPKTKELIYSEIEKWRKKGNDRVDVIVATPPCQGISVINHKKNAGDIQRNSLVIESVEIVKKINPRFFIFENVMAFQKTICVTSDNEALPIGEYIERELGPDYVVTGRVLNFMNYGSNSSRTRTLMIGVAKEYRNAVSPYDLYPLYRQEKTLRQVIGNFPVLDWGEIDPFDYYHAFRTYKESMRCWIHDLKEGQSAFDNKDPEKRPHRFVNGVRVENIQKNRDKYTRQRWDRFPQCIHTRNDQLAAQNTVHPDQDRVLSIREIMELMTVPNTFRWMPYSLDELNKMSVARKRSLYRQHEVNIRQCLGEAVPTNVMREIAHNIKKRFPGDAMRPYPVATIISDYHLTNKEALIAFIHANKLGLDASVLMKIAEMSNAKREENAAFYTNKFLAGTIVSGLPSIPKSQIRILEPSVGAGNFLPYLFIRYAEVERVVLDVVDIDQDSLDILSELLHQMVVPKNFEINFICDDFLKHSFKCRYDLIVGNPPFSKLKRSNPDARLLMEKNYNKKTNSTAELFLEKCLSLGDYISLVLNKNILSSPEFSDTRHLLRSTKIERIVDFARYGFTGVSIETVNLEISPKKKPGLTIVENIRDSSKLVQKQSYITDDSYPSYLIYRNESFDKTAGKLTFGVFDVFRDRQVTKSILSHEDQCDRTWVLKAKNIGEFGNEVHHIPGYDVFINNEVLSGLTVAKYVSHDSVYLTPNMTYKPRVIRNPGNVAMDGSVAILIPKNGIELTDEQLAFFSTEEYRNFYKIARNMATQSINVDKSSVFYFGVLQ